MKDAELTTTYFLFSGKFYASLFAGVVFPKAPPSKYRNRMDYVVNNMLSEKNLIKSEGTLFGAFYKTGITEIVIPSEVEVIAAGAFAGSDISELISDNLFFNSCN